MKKKNLKKVFIIITFFLVLILLSLTLYDTYAYDVSLTSKGEDYEGELTFDIKSEESTSSKTITVDGGDVKNVKITLNNLTTGSDLQYKLYTTTENKDNCFVSILNTTESPTSGTIEADDNLNITLVFVNKSSASQSFEILVASGFKDKKINLSSGYEITKIYSYPNFPNLSEYMIPIVYDETEKSWVKADTTNLNDDYYWYEYSTGRWANVAIQDMTKILDLSGNNITGNLVGGTQINGVLELDGVDDYVDCGLANYDFGSTITLIAKYKAPINVLTSTGTPHIFGNWEAAGGGIFLKNQKIAVDLYIDGNSDYNVFASDYAIIPNTSYTIVMTYDGSSLKVYANGELILNEALSGNIKVSPVVYSLGANINAGKETDKYTEGIIDEILIFDRALSDEEVITNYNKTTINIADETDLLLHYDFNTGDDISLGTKIGDSQSEGILGFFTWIPRYKYKVWNLEKQVGTDSYDAYNKGIDIIFEKGTETTGTVTCSYNTSLTPSNNGEISQTCIGNNNDYYTHPAFTYGNKNIEGFWMGKFETTGTETSPTILPDLQSLRQQSIANQFTTSQILTNQSSIYGIGDLDSHMTKNTEWGAVSYLSHSTNGVCKISGCSEIYINNSSSKYTGRSGGKVSGSATSTAYGSYSYDNYTVSTSNSKTTYQSTAYYASTTKNIYGVFDMSGGTNEYVMANMVNVDGIFDGSTAGFSSTPNSKYYDLYAYGETGNDTKAYNRSILGDATGEVVTSASSTGAWHASQSILQHNGYFWLIRGGDYTTTAASNFYFTQYTGEATTNDVGFRISLS